MKEKQETSGNKPEILGPVSQKRRPVEREKWETGDREVGRQVAVHKGHREMQHKTGDKPKIFSPRDGALSRESEPQ